MGGLHFGLAAAINHPQSGDGAGVVVGFANLAPEAGVPDLAIHQDLNYSPLLLFFLGVKEREGFRVDVRRIQLQPHGIRRIQGLSQPGANDIAELDFRDRSNRSPLQPSADQRSLGYEIELTLVESARPLQWNDR